MARASYWVIAATFAAALAATGAQAAAKFEVPVATPVGVTLQPLGAGQGLGIHFSISGGFLAPHKTAFGNTDGKTLYTYAKDEAGKSNCVDACTKDNPPFIAAAGAKASGDWSLVKRPDGAKQWAFKGKPLYTYTGDKMHGSLNGAITGGRGFGAMRAGSNATAEGQVEEGKPQPISADFKPAYYEPETEIQVPHGIKIAGIADANGRGFVDADDSTLYVFEGDPNKDKVGCATPCLWKPVVSPQISFPVGDFKVLSRNDGINQWTYKGFGLYTYAEDRAAQYAKGQGVDKRFKVALVSQYPLPPGVKMSLTEGRGLVWADSKGLTMYRREAAAYHTGGGHAFRRGVVIRAGVGRQVGTSGCDARCEESMKPVLAADNAQSTGYWEVVARNDGKKQWAYRGFAMYTCACDKAPGDMNANDHYDIYVGTDPNKIVDIGTPQVGTQSLFWLISEPY
jgi:predicted lipoprotein with Yx(FWY)xxD motif